MATILKGFESKMAYQITINQNRILSNITNSEQKEIHKKKNLLNISTYINNKINNCS